MRRRQLIAMLGFGLCAGPLRIAAQTAGKVYRLGTLNPGAPFDAANPFGKVLIEALSLRGYRLGENLSLMARGANAQNALVPQLARELTGAGIEALVVAGYPAAAAAKAEGLPTVVVFGAGDPVATHLVDSLARPGGTITGISDDATALSTKRLALLQRLVPGLRNVAMLWNKDDLGMTLRYEASRKAAEALGVAVRPLGVREPDDFEEGFSAMASSLPDAILMVSDALTTLNRKRVFEFAEAHRLPAIYEYDFHVRAGGLMSYGPDVQESFQRAAVFVDRIFKGAKPADLPFEQPTRYPFLINLKAAKAIGLAVPADLLALADEVIE